MNLPNPFPNSEQKAGNKGALIVFVLDKSSSMQQVRQETIDGFNGFLKQQKEMPDAFFTLVQFNEYTSFAYKNRPAKVVYELTANDYQPSGWTALNDAFGAAMVDTDEFLKSKKENERPAVIFVVMTDGAENASKRFDSPIIKQMVESRQSAGWGFTFLGANIDAFAASAALGIGAGTTASYNQATSTVSAFASTANLVSRYRSATVAGQSTASVSYTDLERSDMKGE